MASLLTAHNLWMGPYVFRGEVWGAVIPPYPISPVMLLPPTQLCQFLCCFSNLAHLSSTLTIYIFYSFCLELLLDVLWTKYSYYLSSFTYLLSQSLCDFLCELSALFLFTNYFQLWSVKNYFLHRYCLSDYTLGKTGHQVQTSSYIKSPGDVVYNRVTIVNNIVLCI